MKRHSLLTNFQFIKTLSNSKSLGRVKLKEVPEGFLKENNELIYRSIYYKNAGDEYKIGKLSRGTIKLTEYINNEPQPLKYIKR